MRLVDLVSLYCSAVVCTRLQDGWSRYRNCNFTSNRGVERQSSRSWVDPMMDPTCTVHIPFYRFRLASRVRQCTLCVRESLFINSFVKLDKEYKVKALRASRHARASRRVIGILLSSDCLGEKNSPLRRNGNDYCE